MGQFNMLDNKGHTHLLSSTTVSSWDSSTYQVINQIAFSTTVFQNTTILNHTLSSTIVSSWNSNIASDDLHNILKKVEFAGQFYISTNESYTLLTTVSSWDNSTKPDNASHIHILSHCKPVPLYRHHQHKSKSNYIECLFL
jgi:hypothetical protein